MHYIPRVDREIEHRGLELRRIEPAPQSASFAEAEP
jgi:hypothetical protein